MTQPAPVETEPAAPPPPTVPMQDRQGNLVQVPIDQAKDAFNAGKLGFVGPIRVRSPEGKIGTVAPDKAEQFFSHPDAQVATDSEWQQAEVQKKYGGAAGMAATAGLGAASGATLGLSDELAATLGGDETRQYIREHYEANPGTALASKVGGSLAPALLSGGASEGVTAAEGTAAIAEAGEAAQAATLARTAEAGTEAAAQGGGALSKVIGAARSAARAVSSPVEGVSRAGGAVEDAVTTLLGGEGEGSTLSRLAKAALAKGAGLGTEGAIYGAADQLDEQMLGDPDLNAEKILASGVHGALLGAALGGTLSAAGELGTYILGRAHPTLSGLAEREAVRALEPKAAATRAFQGVPGGPEAVGRRLLDEGLVKAGDTLEDIAPRLTAAKEAAGEKIGQILETADRANVEGPNVAELTKRLRDQVLAPLGRAPELNGAAIKKVEAFIRDAEHFAGVPSAEDAAAGAIDREALAAQPMKFQEAQKLKKTLQQSIAWQPKSPFVAPDKANEAAQKAYGIFTDYIDEQGDKAAKDLGLGFSDDYKEARKAYAQLKAADSTAQNSLRLKEGRNLAAPSDKAVGIGAAAGLLAHGAGGPAGLVAGLGSAVAHHAIRERTASTSAALLDKLTALRSVERGAQTVDRQVDRGVAGLVGDTSKAAPKPRAAIVGGSDGYETRVKAVQKAAGNLTNYGQQAAAAAAPLAAHAPRTAQAFQGAATRAVTYLAQQMPRRQPAPSLTPQFDRKYIASDAEKARFVRQFDAIHDPAMVLKEAASGRVTADQIDAIRQVYPKLYGQIVQQAQTRLADLKHPLDYSQKLTLGLVLGIPADPTMAADFVRAMQVAYATEAPASAEQLAQKPHHGATKRPIETPAKTASLTIGGKPA